LVKGRRMTSYYTIQDDIRNAGADWTDEDVVRDRNWVTSRQPSDIPAFNRAVADLLTGVRAKQAA
jgi:protease I